MTLPRLKTSPSGNKFLHNYLLAKGNRFPDFKFIRFTCKENKLSFQIIRAFLFSSTKAHFVETVLKM